VSGEMRAGSTTGIGIVGCGNICERYVTGLRRFPELRIVGCADKEVSRARQVEAEHAVPAFDSVEDLLSSREVDVVVNITPPLVHGHVSLDALAAGKDVYVEKPLSGSLAEASRVLEVAAASGRLLGCAPDTFLGSGIQTARAALDSGIIGDPIGAAGFVSHSRAEEWHPDPSFLFEAGGGPLLDMGPYYVTALVVCLGSIAEVAGMARIGASVRTVSAPNRLVDSIAVEVPTHTSAAIRFASGVVGTMLMSFDLWHEDYPHIEIYGTLGALRLPRPFDFDGDVSVRLNDETDWRVLPPRLPVSGSPGRDQELWGIGVADLAAARGGGLHRAHASLGYHALEVLSAVASSSDEERFVSIESRVDRPEPVDPVRDTAMLPWS
jgi:predicted dehydrogenase